jgi:predicted KAP-like P-loop ATPase
MNEFDHIVPSILVVKASENIQESIQEDLKQQDKNIAKLINEEEENTK